MLSEIISVFWPEPTYCYKIIKTNFKDEDKICPYSTYVYRDFLQTKCSFSHWVPIKRNFIYEHFYWTTWENYRNYGNVSEGIYLSTNNCVIFNHFTKQLESKDCNALEYFICLHPVILTATTPNNEVFIPLRWLSRFIHKQWYRYTETQLAGISKK